MHHVGVSESERENEQENDKHHIFSRYCAHLEETLNIYTANDSAFTVVAISGTY